MYLHPVRMKIVNFLTEKGKGNEVVKDDVKKVDFLCNVCSLIAIFLHIGPCTASTLTLNL